MMQIKKLLRIMLKTIIISPALPYAKTPISP